jgi:serine/threonine protein kinase/regulator of sirC expression with transglutaminase-like and TPR domain
MTVSAAGRTWDQASSATATRLARQFEANWRAAPAGSAHPDPLDYLPDDPLERSGARLALLRTEMTLRWEDGKPVAAEDYLARYPDLDDETQVALIYEEFCLREEDSDAPTPAEYIERFPGLADRLRRVFDIHDLVGSAKSTALVPSSATPLPEAGQTIAGFRLVEELGRGAFARVFRAQEHTLADRPVALKVSRTGSREPQALAKLQHTHIVPVHSYQTDPETGLHLLCMPYFGRVTLARVLADPKVRIATTGAEVVAALDRLDPAGGLLSERPAGRLAMTERSYPRAVAWWGARLAEALQHAHERGVLHRDVKPSNVLITGDGMPMLLDFNLACDPYLQDAESAPTSLGGTLAYMAPEQLEALADGTGDSVEARADIYSLGVVLYEAVGARPFLQPTGARSVSDALLRAAQERRKLPPPLRARYPEVPPELENVICHCLAPNPADRYARAAELAADLQAVADDAPLRFAREPFARRELLWLRHNRWRLVAVIIPLLVALFAVANFLEARHERESRRQEVDRLMLDGRKAMKNGEYDLAVSHFDLARSNLEKDRSLGARYFDARDQYHQAVQRRDAHKKVAALHSHVEDLRFRLLDPEAPRDLVQHDVRAALEPFFVFASADWTRLNEWGFLSESDRGQLFAEIDDLLFLWSIALDRYPHSSTEHIDQCLANCAKAPAGDRESGPWRALRAHFLAAKDGKAPVPSAEPSPEGLSAQECFQWALIRQDEGNTSRAIAWLERAVSREPNHFWYQFYLAFTFDRAGQMGPALMHYGAAIALNPRREWPYYNRARIFRSQGALSRALEDLQKAIALAGESGYPEARLEEGLTRQSLGDLAGARAAYDAIPEATGTLSRAARLNRARLDVEQGDFDRAAAEYNVLVQQNPADTQARLARAQLALRLGHPSAAERDLSALIHSAGSSPLSADLALKSDALVYRARARLALAWPRGALEDADAAFSLEPSPGRERLRLRALLAAGQSDLGRLDRPETIDLLPAGGRALTADLRAAAARLNPAADAELGPPLLAALRERAIILAALGDAKSAEASATRAIAAAPNALVGYLIRGRVRLRAQELSAALEDANHVVDVDPGDARGWELRGAIRLGMRQPGSALVDLDRAIRLGAEGSGHALRALALADLKRPVAALEEWKLALRHDRENPRYFLARARTLIALAEWDSAIADLEAAASWASDRPDLLDEIVTAFRVCLPERPDRKERVQQLEKRSSLVQNTAKN